MLKGRYHLLCQIGRGLPNLISDAMLDTKKTKRRPKLFTLVGENENIRAITHSMDLLIPGFYAWFGRFTFRIGGSVPDDVPYKYPGEIHSFAGVALVLPGYRILLTRVAMTLNKHQIQGLPAFNDPVTDSGAFEKLMTQAGYSNSGMPKT